MTGGLIAETESDLKARVAALLAALGQSEADSAGVASRSPQPLDHGHPG